jgi:CRP/FNR family transcriptional regulator, cyclic AMP receptor protein
MSLAALNADVGPPPSIFDQRPPSGAGGRRPIRVFEHDRRLVAGLAGRERDLALHRGVADSEILDLGEWLPPTQEELGGDAFGVLVLDGVLMRTISFSGLDSPELLGPGDLLRPWQDGAGGSLEFATEWRAVERAMVAWLDERFARRVSPFPCVTATLLERSVQRAWWLSAQVAIAHVRRAEPRLLLLFWHLADRWGRVTPAGVELPLRLTHAAVAQLACMRRPTVSTTLGQLADAGEIRRNADGTWLLTGSPPALTPPSARSLLRAA